MIAEEKGKWSAKLNPISTSEFIIGNFQPAATLEFIKDKNGQVSKIKMHQGQDFEWKKVVN